MSIYNNPLSKPVCFAIPEKLSPDQEPCSGCYHRTACVGAVSSAQRLASIRNGGSGLGSFSSYGVPSRQAPVAAPNAPVAPPAAMAAVANSVPAAPPPRPLPAAQYTPSSANSSVVYERGPDVLREVAQRTVLAGAAAVFEELGRFTRNDGYRLGLFAGFQPKRIIRCATCQADSPQDAKFCSHCGRTFGPST